jgi:hypothetical protein
MARFVNGAALTAITFIEQWIQLAGVSSLLACAERTGIRIGIWGGCVRNFVFDGRPISEGGRSVHFIDFVDSYSDVDCVIDRADDWPLIAQSISASVAFAGYHRWEFQTLEQALSSASSYARIGAESFIVWHEGFDAERKPKISIQPLEGKVGAFLENPLGLARSFNTDDQVINEDPWQVIFDSLRLSRYFLQYPTEPSAEGRPLFFPDRRRFQHLMDTPEINKERSHNWLRFDLALLDLLVTARVLEDAIKYLTALSDFLPSSFLGRSRIFASVRERYSSNLAFFGNMVYRQRNSDGVQLRLLTRKEVTLSHGEIKGVVPWTPIWSLGTGGDDCCRHEDFKNGIAVVSWRSLNPNITYSQAQAFELAPVAQIARETPYGEPPNMTPFSPQKLLPIPGIVRVGASLTLRFDHAYVAQLLGHNVQVSVGIEPSIASIAQIPLSP